MINSRFEENQAVSVLDKSSLYTADSLQSETNRSRSLLQQSAVKEDQDETEHYWFSACGSGGGGGICLVFNNVPVASLNDVHLENVILRKNRALVGGSDCNLDHSI